MLSSSFKASRHDGNRRANLYRGLARIMLRLASVPLPRIGSWTMDDRGIVSLTNRPLLDLTLFFGKHQIPTDIPRVCYEHCSSAPTSKYVPPLLY